MIKIQGLNKYFNKGKQNEIHVINDVSLDLPKSGMVAIFGKSGCGKTTLLNAIGGLDSFESGVLSIDGMDITKDTDVVRNRYVGYIFQNYNLNKTQTCFENIASALRLCGINDTKTLQTRVNAALACVDMVNYAGRTPDTLSGGQQQRIAIARAIVKNPSIILADEPTGNLDEANTVMIMNLLKQISQDRLVLLVTHEANLVDYYCDTVVELSDGKIKSIRKNESANGYTARGKNDIYLGELEKSSVGDQNAQIEFYGDAPDTPIKLRIVNNSGKIFVRIDTPNAQIIDDTSEIKLREGVYVANTGESVDKVQVDMSALPPIEGKAFGKLFTFGSAVKSGYDEGFRKARRGKKVLRRCMSMFSVVMVVVAAVFGTSFDKLINVQNSYNHNVFYVYTPDGEVSDKINEAYEKGQHGIDYVRLNYDVNPTGDSNVKFTMGFFESFEFGGYDEGFSTNAVYLDNTMAKDLETVAGSTDDLKDSDILITTKVADALLDMSSLGYISEYEDLIGLMNMSLRIDGQRTVIAGVVESDETAIYLTEMAMAKHVMGASGLSVYPEASCKKGEVILVARNSSEDLPRLGKTVNIHGKSFKVGRVIKYSGNYEEWLKNNGIDLMTEDEYMLKKVEELYPTITDHWEKENKRWEIQNEYRYDYVDYYSQYIDRFMEELCMFDASQNLELWAYSEKGEDFVKYRYYNYGSEHYSALKYKEQYGKYPTEFNYDENLDKMFNDLYTKYRGEFESRNNNMNSGNKFSGNAYYVCESDYIALSKTLGETHDSAKGGINSNVFIEDVYYESKYNVSYSTTSSGGTAYTLIHSDDPKATAAWIEKEFAHMEAKNTNLMPYITPDGIFDTQVKEFSQQIITGFIAMAVVIAVLSVCMYFIMRSSLLNRIKEVGIYRAIGVSKKNLVFKFFIEALVLTTLTVLIGYALTSGFVFWALGLSSMMENVMFYPVWLAAAVLGVLYFICLFFGTLPILSLLRKTPSEILAKYDI